MDFMNPTPDTSNLRKEILDIMVNEQQIAVSGGDCFEYRLADSLTDLINHKLAEQIKKLSDTGEMPVRLVNTMLAKARIDELNKMVKEWGYGEYPSDDFRHSMDWEDYANYRLKQLNKEIEQ